MIILREITLPTGEQIGLYKNHSLCLITLFEMIYKLIDIVGGPNPDDAALLKGYDTAVHLADVWTSPINVFMNNKVSAGSLKRRFPDLKIESWDTPEQHSDPRINGKIRAVIWTPNYEILEMLHTYATIAKD